jgi:Fic family protein
MASGTYIQIGAGASAFIPYELPPEIDAVPLIDELDKAAQAVARLDGLTIALPNPDIFIHNFIRQEALTSSQIEGVETTLDDVLQAEAIGDGRHDDGWIEVSNHIEAQRRGVHALASGRPLGSSLLREIHGVLMSDVRGADKHPGAFRTTQVHIGRRGRPMAEASYVPPPPIEVPRLMDDLEKYLRTPDASRPLIRSGIAHAQFEMVHPFEDGNGRVGRMLVGLMLCEAGILREPMLYLSGYLNEHRSEYIERLAAVSRDGDWTGWLQFFLAAVASSGTTATTTAEEIMRIRRRDEALVAQTVRSQYAHALMNLILRTPYVTPQTVVQWVKCSKPTATTLLREFTSIGILNDLGKSGRNRFYRYDAMWQALRGDFVPSPRTPVDETIQT